MFKKADVNGGGVFVMLERSQFHALTSCWYADVRYRFAGGIDLEEFTAALKTDQWSQVNQMLNPLGALADMDVCTTSMLLVLTSAHGRSMTLSLHLTSS